MFLYNSTDEELISFALDMWANYIETYCVSLSAEDANGKFYPKGHHYEPNKLTSAQKTLVNRIRNLASKFKEENNGGK